MYDVIIIGSGPGGMTAALYASRSDLNVLVIERGAPGGQLMNTADVENYPGFSNINGPDLAMKMYENSTNFGAKHTYGNVKRLENTGRIKKVYCEDEVFEAKSVIIASGSDHRKLGIKGEEAFAGRGVSYCAVCDGAFFKGSHLYVIGGGDSAVEEGLYLTQFASQVTIVHRRNELRAQKIIQERAFKNEKIDFIWDAIPIEIVGDEKKVTELIIENTKNKQRQTVKADGIFIYVGLDPLSDPFKELGITNKEGWIETNDRMETSVPGVYAIGDVRQTVLRQIATAVGDGSIAGQEVYNYLSSLDEN